MFRSQKWRHNPTAILCLLITAGIHQAACAEQLGRPTIPKYISIPGGIEPLLPTYETLAMFSKHLIEKDGARYHFRLFTPKVANAKNSTYPLVVWLHGHGDLELKLDDGQLNYIEHIFKSCRRDDVPFFLVAMQCPEKRSWSSVMTVQLELINLLTEQNPIDPKRRYVIGISSGASAAWQMAIREPEMFAAIAPLGGGKVDTEDMNRIRSVAVWAFHSRKDKDVPVTGSINAMAAFKSVGGRGELSLIDTRSHDCWNAAFHDYHLMSWLLRQQRGKRASWRLATRLRFTMEEPNWVRRIAQFGIPVIILIVSIGLVALKRVIESRRTITSKAQSH